MKSIDLTTYRQLLASATVIERDGYGEKVLKLPDGPLVKIFRRKRRLTTALFYPYALRFVNNARRLAELGVLTVNVLDIAYCPAAARHLVTYQPLPGMTLRDALKVSPTDHPVLLGTFAELVADLHRKGVYFRSLHFGNVIVPTDGGRYGLIDVADLKVYRGPLSVRQRARNFAHMLRYQEDHQALTAYGWDRFLDGYLQAAALPERARHNLQTRLRPLAELFPAAD